MLDKQSKNFGTDGTISRTMVANINSMAHVCSNTFLIIFLRRDNIVFWKMSLLHWLTKLIHQTFYREKTIGEVLWRLWRHGDWMLKTVSEIAFCFILTNEFKDTTNSLQLFLFTNAIRCSRLPLWVSYFIYLKFTRVSSIVYQLLHLAQSKKQIG